jgi:hypothetical protein
MRLVPPSGKLSWFFTRFKSRVAHRRGEHWNARDTRIYTGFGLDVDKNPTTYVCRLYNDSLS